MPTNSPRIGPTILLAFISASLCGGAAHAQTCPNFDLQIIQQPPFLVGYKSWVKPPRTGSPMYSFGRCAGTMNSNELTIEWKETQLSGLTTSDLALIATFPFIDGKIYPIKSDLKFQADPTQSYDKSVFFEANAEEAGGSPQGQTKVSSEVETLQAQLRRGEKVDDTVVNVTSTAQMPIARKNSPGAAFTLHVSLTSYLDKN